MRRAHPAFVLALLPASGVFAACDGSDPGRISLSSGARSEVIAVATVASGFGLTGGPVLDLTLCAESTPLLAEMSADLVGQQMSLDIDGDPVWSAVVAEPILGGSLQISGAFSLQEVEDKARRLREAAGLGD